MRSIVRACARSFVRLFVRVFFCSFVRACMRSFVRSFVRSCVRPVFRSFVRSFVLMCVSSFVVRSSFRSVGDLSSFMVELHVCCEKRYFCNSLNNNNNNNLSSSHADILCVPNGTEELTKALKSLREDQLGTLITTQ